MAIKQTSSFIFSSSTCTCQFTLHWPNWRSLALHSMCSNQYWWWKVESTDPKIQVVDSIHRLHFVYYHVILCLAEQTLKFSESRGDIFKLLSIEKHRLRPEWTADSEWDSIIWAHGSSFVIQPRYRIRGKNSMRYNGRRPCRTDQYQVVISEHH